MGDRATATGSITTTATTVSQADYQRRIERARKALIDDEPCLEELSAGLSVALGQLLRVARKIPVDQLAVGDAQAKLKEALDDMWAEQIAPELRGRPLPESLEVARVLRQSPLTATIWKTMLVRT